MLESMVTRHAKLAVCDEDSQLAFFVVSSLVDLRNATQCSIPLAEQATAKEIRWSLVLALCAFLRETTSIYTSLRNGRLWRALLSPFTAHSRKASPAQFQTICDSLLHHRLLTSPLTGDHDSAREMSCASNCVPSLVKSP